MSCTPLDTEFRRLSPKFYTDEIVYQAELANIFGGRSWNYLCLMCEVPDAGDYIETYIGETPVIVVRDKSGDINAFVNRCTHRGSKVCIANKGKAKQFICPYHEWAFDLSGKLKGVPYRHGIDGKGGMPSDFNISDHNLAPVKVAVRNGVVFGSLAPDMDDLATYLGPKICSYFDRVCDGRPLKVIGKMRHIIKANWKLQIENVKDPIHAAILHSFFKVFGIWRSDQKTDVVVSETGSSSVLVSTASFDKLKPAKAESALSLADPRMIQHIREFEGGTGAVMTIWPNLIFLQQLNCLVMRHVRPDGASRCIQTWTFFGFQDEDISLTEQRLLQANLLGPAGFVTVDDNEVLELIQEDAVALGDTPVVLEAGEGMGDTDYMVSESAIRAFYRFYKSALGEQPHG